jgi:hypothetical protein
MRGAIVAAESDSVSCIIRTRHVLVHVVRDVYRRRIGKPSGTQPLEEILARLVKEGRFPEELAGYVGAVKGLANRVAHDPNKSYPELWTSSSGGADRTSPTRSEMASSVVSSGRRNLPSWPRVVWKGKSRHGRRPRHTP